MVVPPSIVRAEAERDERAWRRWADGIAAAPARRAAVVRSLLTLQLLTYSPSGAPVAAPTTSLPELVGGERNDRAARMAHRRGGRAAKRVPAWQAARDRVAADVRANGFDDDLGAYTAAYGSDELDAAVLLLPILGIEAPHSSRVRGTVEAVRGRLGAGGPLVYRYLGDDGLPGGEGAFLPCSFWLVQALVGIGRRAEAGELFDELVALGRPLGLYAEEMDPVSGEHLGNFPQALTHAALLQAAAALDTPTATTEPV